MSFINIDTLAPSLYQCVDAHSIQNSFDYFLSHFRTPVSASSSIAKRLPPRLNCFTRQTHPTVNRKYFFMNIPCIESFCPQKTQNRSLLFGGILLEHNRYFDYWNQPLIMRMHVCYLDCHEAGLCCYLVIHIESLLRPLQLFYFISWPIYWLSFICSFTNILEEILQPARKTTCYSCNFIGWWLWK
jgi:hypothetical protein